MLKASSRIWMSRPVYLAQRWPLHHKNIWNYLRKRRGRLNLEFPFSLTSCLNKAKEPGFIIRLFLAGSSTDGFTSFPKGFKTKRKSFCSFPQCCGLDSVVQGLNSGHPFHFLRRCTLSLTRFFLWIFKWIIIIIIIMSCRLHGYPWPSQATSPYRSSPLAILQDYIPYPHIAAVCRFELVFLLLLCHMWGSIGVHHLWARPYFSSSVLHVWFI